MAIDPDYFTLMPETITWSTAGTLSSYGVPTWSTASGRSMAARVIRKHDEVRDKTGAVREAQGTVWCASSTGSSFTPSADDRLTLSDGSSPPVLSVETIPDETGTHHHKVRFGY